MILKAESHAMLSESDRLLLKKTIWVDYSGRGGRAYRKVAGDGRYNFGAGMPVDNNTKEGNGA